MRITNKKKKGVSILTDLIIQIQLLVDAGKYSSIPHFVDIAIRDRLEKERESLTMLKGIKQKLGEQEEYDPIPQEKEILTNDLKENPFFKVKYPKLK